MPDFTIAAKGIRYCGAKGKCREIVRYINQLLPNNGGLFWDAFHGSGKVIASVARKHTRVGTDLDFPITVLLRAVRDGWNPPKEVSEETYRVLMARRDDLEYVQTEPMMGFAGYGCSFGGRYFQGYARSKDGKVNFAASARRSLLRQAPFLEGCTFKVRDYRQGWPTRKTPDVVYMDPPYDGTKPVGSKVSGKFDSKEMWGYAVAWSAVSTVVVSEYACPVPGAVVLWEKSVASGLRFGTGGDGHSGGDGTRKQEKLFLLTPGARCRVGLGIF